jgi:hypothetical protein
MMEDIVVFLAFISEWETPHGRHLFRNRDNRWNILGFNFTKRNALSSVYKISMIDSHDR